MPYALLVEDNKAHALLFERCLRRVPNSPSLRHIRDGRSALDFLAAKSLQRDLPSLVILDLKLPVLDGFDVLHLIRSVPDLCSLPVIILSTSDREADIRLSKTYGATDFWTKPVSTESLTRALTKYPHPEE